MPDQIMFNGTQILFKGGKISFCPADCDCPPDDTHDPPPPPPTDCVTCKSTVPCSYFPTCTPKQLQVTFSDVEITGSTIDCTSSQSVSISGTLDGTFTLQQDSSEPCRWLLEVPSSAITATRYTLPSGGGTSNSTTRLRIAVQRVPDGIAVSASMIFDPYVEFILFLGPLLMNTGDPFPLKPFTVTGYPFSVYCTNTNITGGRLGTNGTATVSTCGPVPPPTARHPDSADTACKLLKLLTGMTGTGCWDVGTVPDQTLILHHVGDWHWTVPAPFDIGGATLVAVDLSFKTGFLTYGDGWFIVLQKDGVDAAYYRKYGDTPVGGYNLLWSDCSTMPAILTIEEEQCPVADCTSNKTWPTSIAVKVTDTGSHYDEGSATTWPDITGIYVLELTGGDTYNYQFDNTPTALNLTLTCYGDHWEAGIERTTSSLSFDDYFGKLPQKDNGPPRGVAVPYRSDPPDIEPPGSYADVILEVL
jgi:hypothetical protein